MEKSLRELLLKDLCARLGYGVLVMVYDDEINEPVELLSIYPKRDKPLEIDDGWDENSSTYWSLEDVKPYIRPMESMTEEEENEWRTLFMNELLKSVIDGAYPNNIIHLSASQSKSIDWLNAHHFDYRGLIDKGLALEAPEDMYETK